MKPYKDGKRGSFAVNLCHLIAEPERPKRDDVAATVLNIVLNDEPSPSFAHLALPLVLAPDLERHISKMMTNDLSTCLPLAERRREGGSLAVTLPSAVVLACLL